MRDKVTISLYSTEINSAPGYNSNFISQFSNIEKICKGLIAAAKNADLE